MKKQMNINNEEYHDKVRGCWIGKNIGGTLGTPLEGRPDVNDVDFYTHDLNGVPLPNDDLDLQLVWLAAAERYGVYNLNFQIIGECWLNNIIGPWNEYSVCRFNVAKGLYPPLSGATNNDHWKNSNGAWIRSEIWACLFPGCPDEAIRLAYLDACADHCGDGIYAEMFTAALESAAFIVSDIDRLIAVALSKIPDDCRVARSVGIVRACRERGEDWLTAREKVVEDSRDLGWFQAPANVAFAVIGLLYGEGDFGKSICLAVNCGDDTDCTAATVGATLGIMYGASRIPQKWIVPIGDSIKNIAINPFGRLQLARIPKTITELTARVIRLAQVTRNDNPDLFRIGSGETVVPEEYAASLSQDRDIAREIWSYSPYRLVFQLPFAEIAVEYESGVILNPGDTRGITIEIGRYTGVETEITCRWHLPEGWSMTPSRAGIMVKPHWLCRFTHTLQAGEFSDSILYITLEIRLAGRTNPFTLHVPFLQSGTVMYPKDESHPAVLAPWVRQWAKSDDVL